MSNLVVSRPISRPRKHALKLDALAVPAGVVGIAIGLIFAWGLAASTQTIASPLVTVRLLLRLIVDGSVIPHFVATFRAVFIGFVLALMAGIPIGSLLGAHPYWRKVWDPVIVAFYSVPKITLFPVFILFLGLGLRSRVAMAFIHAVFPILIATTAGVKDLRPIYVKVARVFRANSAQIITRIYVPAIAPSLVAASRMGFSLAIIGVVLSEFFAAEKGLGYLIMHAFETYQVDQMFALILLLYLTALAFNAGFRMIEKRLPAVNG